MLRIWDCLFNEGSKIIFRVALTLIKQHQAFILEATSVADICEKFKEITKGSFVTECHTFMQVSGCSQPVLCSAVPFAQPVKGVSWLHTSVCLAKHLSLYFLWTSSSAGSLHPSPLKQPRGGAPAPSRPMFWSPGPAGRCVGATYLESMAAAAPLVPSAIEWLALRWAGSSAEGPPCRASQGSLRQKHQGLE